MLTMITLLSLGIGPPRSRMFSCHAQESQFATGADQATTYRQMLIHSPVIPNAWWNEYAHKTLLTEPD